MTANKERISLDFGDELNDFDPTIWEKSPTAEPKPKVVDAKKMAEASGFPSREPTQHEVQVPKQRRRRTGRNVQFNIKAKTETIEAFCAIADANGWGLGETFEIATSLLISNQSTNK